MHRVAVGGAEHGADEEGGREDAAGAADADGQAGSDHLAQQQHQQEGEHVLPADAILQYRVAHAIHLRQHEEQQAQQQSAGRRAQPLGAMPECIAEVLGAVEHADERHAHPRGQQAKQSVEEVLPEGDDMEWRQREKGLRAEGSAPDHVRGDRGQYYQAKGFGLEVAQDQLEPEEDTGDGGVEGSRDAAGGAAGHQET